MDAILMNKPNEFLFMASEPYFYRMIFFSLLLDQYDLIQAQNMFKIFKLFNFVLFSFLCFASGKTRRNVKWRKLLN